jgi:tRNA threonylcarbamoyladenosine biosynthesis protein TsaB
VEHALAIAGCGPRLELALASTRAPALGLVAMSGPTPRSDLIVAAVDLLLRAAGLAASDLQGVAATRGPGSFTGIRVALATAQGLVLAHGLAGHGFSSLLAQAARTEEPDCVAIQPARRGFVYAQPYARRGDRREPGGEPDVVAIASLADAPVPVIAPEGLELPDGTPRARPVRTTAEALLALLDGVPAADASTLVPLYLEPPPAVPPRGTARPWLPSPKDS